MRLHVGVLTCYCGWAESVVLVLSLPMEPYMSRRLSLTATHHNVSSPPSTLLALLALLP